MRHLAFLLLLLLCLAAATGCIGQPTNNSLETVSAEQIREMIREAQESMLASESEKLSTAASENTAIPQDNAAVFWTDGGEVWHTDRTCSSLQHASTVHAGTVTDAQAAGKDRLCRNCTP